MKNKRKTIPTDTVLVFFALIFLVMSILTACGAEEALPQEETEPALTVVEDEPDDAGEPLTSKPLTSEPEEGDPEAPESEEPEEETPAEGASGGIVDPAIQNEVHVVSDTPYVMSGDQSFWVEDKVLNNGYTMPVLGLGTYALTVEQAENSVYHALKYGVRLIDTARAYNNEDGVGRGIRRAIDEGLVTREEIFVTTKVWDTDFGNAGRAFEQSLERLGLDYVDLVLLHHVPRTNDEKAYHELEEKVAEGKIRSLGLSNIYLGNDTFDRMYEIAEIKPVLVQNENHPFFQNTDFQAYVGEQGLFIESWYPLGGRGFTQEYFNNEILLGIAAAHDKTVAQILLRWHIQAGYITIPGSSNPDHIAENYDIFCFELTDEEMQTIREMDTGHGNFNLRG